MEMAGRRSTYSLLSQSSPDDPPPPAPPKFDSPPSDKARPRAASPFDWPIAPLQRQSSGSSYGDSTLSGGDFYMPPTISSTAIDVVDSFNPAKAKDAVGFSSSTKSWAQQAEETYQLQLALALRLCSEAACADDPNFLDAADQTVHAAPASMSHRFWVRR